MVSQEEVREKLIKRAEREKQTYIARQIGMPKQVLSDPSVNLILWTTGFTYIDSL